MEKIKVVVGTCEIGDEISGQKITRFGKTWTEKRASRKYFKGQLWEPCYCGQEPIYMSCDGMCEKCIHRSYGTDTEVCYAYFN